MKQAWIVLALTFVSISPMSMSILSDYQKQRESFMMQDNAHRIGHDLKLSPSEERVNEILTKLIKSELSSMIKEDHSISETNFIHAKNFIEKSEVYSIIRRMPKGAIHHIHDLALASYDWLIKKWTYKDNCYMCYDHGLQATMFKFASSYPRATTNCQWSRVNFARKKSRDPEHFDQMLLANLTLTTEDVSASRSQLQIWKKFQKIFVTVSGLVNFEEVFKDYYLQGLKELVNDNIQYAEIREVFGALYDENGTEYKDVERSLKEVIQVVEYFKQNIAPDYFGSRHIYSLSRFVSETNVAEGIETALHLRNKYPESFAGYDLVGQEDTGFPLLHYIKELLLPKTTGTNVPFFFHAGETDWEGERIDENLLDALLLNTSRIGHAYALVKHPFLRKYARTKGVAVEMCPISNQVLGLVKDLRNHPGTVLFAENHPVSVNPDDPAIWGASGVSHDLYEVLIGMVPPEDSLKVLKKLALNSIEYSSLPPQRKSELMKLWEKKWAQFISETLDLYSSSH